MTKMTGREWRVVVECLVADINSILELESKDKKTWNTGNKFADMYYNESEKRITAEAKLDVIRSRIESFSYKHLNRETCDDFDEYE